MPHIPYNARLIAGDTYAVPGLTNAGFIGGLLIDTTEDEAPFAGVEIDRVAITHGHADHFAIAHVLRDGGAKVFAARDDAALVENPDINIRGMFSWAKPGDVLTTKLFRGTPCKVDGYLEDWDDERAQTVPLPGHTLGHSGFVTRDRVLFSGDALYQRELWDKHRLPYAIEPDDVVRSLKVIRDLDWDWIVPGHGHPARREQAETDIDYHLGQIAEIEEMILDALKEPMSTEQTVALVASRRGLPSNPATYWLAVSTVKGFLGDLLSRGRVEFYVAEHTGWWHSVS
jgi:glyoxylase-like metal-dependent hydrolase (beta-lactamase superfamily II)